MRDIGFNAVRPRIDRISFKKAGYITLDLADGRTISSPLARFPGIERLTVAERRRYHIADEEMIIFRNDDEIYHIQDFLGTYGTNAYRYPGKQSNRRLNTEKFLKSKGYSIVKRDEDKKELEVKTTIIQK